MRLAWVDFDAVRDGAAPAFDQADSGGLCAIQVGLRMAISPGA